VSSKSFSLHVFERTKMKNLRNLLKHPRPKPYILMSVCVDFSMKGGE